MPSNSEWFYKSCGIQSDVVGAVVKRILRDDQVLRKPAWKRTIKVSKRTGMEGWLRIPPPPERPMKPFCQQQLTSPS